MGARSQRIFLIRKLLVIFYLISYLDKINSLPTVDPGVFVLQGVSTCREGKGYCLLGLSCTIDKDFADDDLGGNCDGLTKSFTSKISFVCCRYINESKIKIDTYETTISPFTISDDKFQLLDENPVHTETEEERIVPEGVDPSSLIDIIGAVTDSTGIVKLITRPYQIPSSSSSNINNTQEDIITTTPIPEQELTLPDETVDENTEYYNAMPIGMETGQSQNAIYELGNDQVELDLNSIKKIEALKDEIETPQETITKKELVRQNQQQILIPLNFLKPNEDPHVYNDMSSYAQPTISTSHPIEADLEMREDILLMAETTTETSYGLMLPSDEEEEKQRLNSSNRKEGLLKPFTEGGKETSALFEDFSAHKNSVLKGSDVAEDETQVISAINVVSGLTDEDNQIKIQSSESIYVNQKPLPVVSESLPLQNFPEKFHQVLDPEGEFEESLLPHPINLNICGIKTTYSQHRHLIRKMEAASVYEWCWSAALMRKEQGKDKFECSGALIEQDLVVTSAACLKRLQKEDISAYRVVLGDSNLRDDLPYGIQFHDISEIITHPDYLTSGGSHANDIGLIRLRDYATISENVCLVCVAQKNSYIPNSSCIVSGYDGGAIPRQIREDVSLLTPMKGVLRVASVELEDSLEECTSSLLHMAHNPILLLYPETFLCDRKKKSARCLDSFDGGSPLVCQAGGRWFLTGISSWSRDCSTDPNVYTKVNSHSDWILATRLRMYGFDSQKVRYFK